MIGLSLILILITFLTAFLIEGLGTIVSVIGLSTLFGANPIIISLAVALDMGKLVVVSFLYKHWKQMGIMMKGYALIASLVTMIITSAGAAGYLTGEFQKAIIGTQETDLKINVLKEQQAKFEERKKQIDDQIANLPANYSKSRITLMKQFDAEQKELQAKIDSIDKELPNLQIKQISVEAKAGPILYISKAFEVPIEMAVKYVVLMIIFVFDPLAVFLIIVGNFLLDERKKKPPTPPSDPKDPEPLGPQEYIPDPAEEEFQRQLALKKVPNIETQIAMAEAEEKIRERTLAQKLDTFDVSQHGGEFTGGEPEDAERQSDQPIIDVELDEPVTPEEPSPMHALPESEPRDEITLEDLRPAPRSSLNDVRGDATVIFDHEVRNSAHKDFYSRS